MLHCVNVSINFSLGDTGRQFTAAPATCPENVFTFKCTVVGDMSRITIWRVNGSSEGVLLHRSTNESFTMCGPDDAFTARPGNGFGTNGLSFTSMLSGTATFALNGTPVECFGPGTSRDADNRVGNSTLEVLGQYVYISMHILTKKIYTLYPSCKYTPRDPDNYTPTRTCRNQLRGYEEADIKRAILCIVDSLHYISCKILESGNDT